MKRCPTCHDDHEDSALVCGSCGVELLEVDAAGVIGGAPIVPTASADARLGTFHPAVAQRIAELLYRRAIVHSVVERDDAAEVRIDVAWRDDLRTELTLSWNDVVGHLDPEVAEEVRASGGRAPGWYDAPQGGHIDRSGKLVVSTVEDDGDEARVIGPILLTAGAILGVVGWYVLDSGGVLTAGFALVLLGLFTPR
jgi:hypothetical protein